MDPKKLRPFVVLLGLLFLFFVSLPILANALIHKPSVQKSLLESLSRGTEEEIRADEIEVYLWNRLGISVRDFEAMRDTRQVFLEKGFAEQVPEARIRLWEIAPGSPSGLAS